MYHVGATTTTTSGTDTRKYCRSRCAVIRRACLLPAQLHRRLLSQSLQLPTFMIEPPLTYLFVCFSITEIVLNFYPETPRKAPKWFGLNNDELVAHHDWAGFQQSLQDGHPDKVIFMVICGNLVCHICVSFSAVARVDRSVASLPVFFVGIQW